MNKFFKNIIITLIAIPIIGFAASAVWQGGTGLDSVGNGAFLYGTGSAVRLGATTSPTVGFITATSTTATSTFAGGLNVAGTSGLTVLQNGNVGVGTTNPSYKLDVYGMTADDGINTNIGINFDQVNAPDSGSLALINSVGNVDAGLHYYYITYYNDIGNTASYGIGSITTDGANGQVTITMPVSANPDVIGRRIHRTKAGGYNYETYLLDVITNNVDTTYIDNIPDSSLTEENRLGYYSPNTTNKMLTVEGIPMAYSDYQYTTFGYAAGDDVTSGSRGAFFGTNAGTSVTTGASNSAFGWSAMKDLTTGSSNTAVGYQSAENITTGSSGVWIGKEAGRYATSGGSNTVVGTLAGAGVSNQSTYSNATILGFLAGNDITTGSGNILLGYRAGELITTGARNIVLGYDIDAPSNTDDDQLVIGNLIFGTGVDGTGTTLSSGNVGIGTTTPFSKLHVTNGASATTTVSIGSIGLSTSKGCVNMNDTSGQPTSFYFVGTTMVIEANYCR